MAVVKTYTITEIDSTKLHQEISATVFVTNFEGLNLSDSTLDILGSTLADEASLDALIATHDPAPTQKELDVTRFKKRASVKNQILSEIAAENMERVRTQIWTTSELISLTQDAELKNLLDDINTLSYEIAYSKADGLTNALLTQAIKDEWKAKLASHFYL